MRTVYLCIGGNLGSRLENLEETRMFIEFNFGDILEVSSVVASEAWGMENAPAFLNQIVVIQTSLTNQELLQEISELEEFYGRTRGEGYQSREMDVDVLFIDNDVLEEGALLVPHPRLHLRRFVLQPLAEIAPSLMHPILRKSISELLVECPDKSEVKPC
ncbi:MAG: 2-amino-4-hydroxy-6-hydroxymethyldihydropteridine diphosphokinase [Flavobacteriales bacterium]